MISFIVPAYNEALEIERCLRSIQRAASESGLPFEIVVVNDASSDDTAQKATQAGARLVNVQLRQISAVRNAGAHAAKGDWLFFVDADTQISPDVLAAAVKVLEQGAVGGGAWVGFAEPMGWVIRLGLWVFSMTYMRLLGWAAGCFLFARREAFEAAGRFDERLFACEEIELSRALKRQGRFVILREPVITSGRKLRMYSVWRMVPFTLKLILRGPKMLKSREGLEWWYEGKREKKD